MFTGSFVVHRYEREEAFHSLQVTVKNARLEDSLEQFVNGEILEGDNAYFCEKCNERVSVVFLMRLSITTAFLCALALQKDYE